MQRDVFVPSVVHRVQPIGSPAVAPPIVPIPLANRVDAQNQEVLRRLAAQESMLARQAGQIAHLTELVRQSLGLATSPPVDEDETDQHDEESDEDSDESATPTEQGSEFGGVATGDVIEPGAQELGEETTGEDVTPEDAAE